MACDSLQDYCLTGTPLQREYIVDAHGHMGPWHNFNVPEDGSATAMVRSMDALGVDVTIASPHIAIGPDYLEGNREVAEAAEQFPGRIVPFVTINPNYPRAEIEAEIAHWHDTTGIEAFKLHPGCHKTTTLDEGYSPVYQYCQEHSLPILSHCWNGEGGLAKVVATLTARYPAITFINAHSASSWDGIEQNCKVCAEHAGFYLDLTGSLLLWGAVETMVDRVGADKILFGTDIPFIDPRPGLGRMLCARISDDDKRRILGLNAKRIYDL
jgi:predicted TIM-barrel fold metal-dependent hydrolase